MELRSFDGAVVLCQVENINVQASDPYFDRLYRSAFSSMLVVGLAVFSVSFRIASCCAAAMHCEQLPTLYFAAEKILKELHHSGRSLATSRFFSMAIKEVGLGTKDLWLREEAYL